MLLGLLEWLAVEKIRGGKKTIPEAMYWERKANVAVDALEKSEAIREVSRKEREGPQSPLRVITVCQ